MATPNFVELAEAREVTEPEWAEAARDGLRNSPKTLPCRLFYDQAGSRLFDRITELPEYYLTRLERGIFAAHAAEMMALAADGDALRVTELGAGSCDKTRLLLRAAVELQGSVRYEPVDVSATALDAARERLEREIPEVAVLPVVADYTRGVNFSPCDDGERRLVLYIGSSIGNFSPQEAQRLLAEVREALQPGDALLLGVDLAPVANGHGKSKTVGHLLAAYDDADGVTAEFNLNLLARLNRELGADFDLEGFEHRTLWNAAQSRIEMHLESLRQQQAQVGGTTIAFAEGETIHTENSYKYDPEAARELFGLSGFETQRHWMDEDGWFAVYLARVAS